VLRHAMELVHTTVRGPRCRSVSVKHVCREALIASSTSGRTPATASTPAAAPDLHNSI